MHFNHRESINEKLLKIMQCIVIVNDDRQPTFADSLVISRIRQSN